MEPSIEERQSLQETLDILADPDEVAAIDQGLEALARGDVYRLDEIAADVARRLGSAERDGRSS